MATIKSYTSVEQSRKLAKILPLESADMFHFIDEIDTVGFGYKKDTEEFYSKTKFEYIPCWSLAALLDILPKYELYSSGDTILLDVNLEALATEGDETLLDLVVNMIIHLHELKKK